MMPRKLPVTKASSMCHHTAILITCSFKKDVTDTLRIIEAAGVGLMEWEVSQEQNAKKTEITIPFIALDMTVRKGA